MSLQTIVEISDYKDVADAPEINLLLAKIVHSVLPFSDTCKMYKSINFERNKIRIVIINQSKTSELSFSFHVGWPE